MRQSYMKRGCRLTIMAVAMISGMSMPAYAQWHECKVKTIGNDMNWISKLIYINVAPDGSAVSVTDGTIQHYNGEKAEVQAKIMTNSENRLVFRWFVDAISTTQKTVRMTYIATLFRDTKKISIFAKDGAYIEEHLGRGVCAPY
jgi:hypothetical protein